MMHVPTLIEKKRDGLELEEHEIKELIDGFTRGDVPEYQMTAFAMAVYFRGMSAAEIAALTRAMMHSGSIFNHHPDSPPKVDKHSTGGVGDKVSLILAPLLACDNLWVPMISGRGLGITGGTLDKLESIPGFNVFLDEERTARQLKKIGVVMIGQTDTLCPADKKLYALRDVTGTVASPALITASIMGKKLAESLDRLVLDVKFGSGAFMKTKEEAQALADGLSSVGTSMGVKISHRLTPMHEPLGCTVGNALEVQEALETLQGGGPPDLRNLTLDLASDVADVSRETLGKWLDDGTAWQRFVQMVEAQDGDATCLDTFSELHQAPVEYDFPAQETGTLTGLDALAIGTACVRLGAGRQKTTDAIDYAVGCSKILKTGQTVKKGETVLRIHARNAESLGENLPLFTRAVQITPN